MSRPVRDMVRPHLVDVRPYDPVDPPEVLAKCMGLPEESIVKLNANENPYGASPKVAEALDDWRSRQSDGVAETPSDDA